MCIAILKTPNTTPLDVKALYNCFTENSDGCGFMFVDPNKRGLKRLRIFKGFFNFRNFYSCYKFWEQMLPQSTFALHFRYATHGLKDKDNCHPFKTHPGVGMIHNGILSMPTKDFTPLTNCRGPHEWESDTAWYCNTYFKRFNMKTLNDAKWKHKTEEFIGKYNKLVFLDWRGEYSIYNENAGHWYKGIWYSNTDYMTKGYEHSSTSWGGPYEAYGVYGYHDDVPERREIVNAIVPTVSRPVLPSERRALEQSDSASDTETKSCCHTGAGTSDRTGVEGPQDQGTSAKIIEEISQASKKAAEERAARQLKYECLWCKKPLPTELVGLSKLCWECDDRYEELTGESPFEVDRSDSLTEDEIGRLRALRTNYEIERRAP